MANSALRSRRWTVILSGLLCGLLALVVIYTKPGAFYSPIAVMVVAAIGLAAVLLQLRFFEVVPHLDARCAFVGKMNISLRSLAALDHDFDDVARSLSLAVGHIFDQRADPNHVGASFSARQQAHGARDGAVPVFLLATPVTASVTPGPGATIATPTLRVRRA